MASVDASNSCIPPSCPLVALGPPLPSTVRGEPCILDGRLLPGDAHPVIVYASGRLVVVRHLTPSSSSSSSPAIQAFCYRGHMANVTVAKLSPSGYYVASADVRGKLRVWSYDNEQHLCKLDLQAALSGPIRDLAWDGDSQRIALVGERSSPSSDCARVIQWDTGVTCGELGQPTRGRASSVDIRPKRPMRIITGGKDDAKCLWNAGPPFKRVVDGTPTEDAHERGAIHCVRFTKDGNKVASVGADKRVCVYDGKTMVLLCQLEQAHEASIYACDWNSLGTQLLTCSADGTVRLLDVAQDNTTIVIAKTWDLAPSILTDSKIPPIGSMQLGCSFVTDDMPVSVAMNGQISILPLSGGQDELQILTGHVAPIAGMAMDHSRGLLYTGDTDGTVCQWNVQTGRALQRLVSPDDTDCLSKVHGGAAIACLAVEIDGSILTAGWDDAIRIANYPDLVVRPELSISLEAQPHAMATGTHLVVLVTVGGIYLLRGGVTVSPLIPLQFTALSVSVSVNDTTVYVGGQDCKIHIFNVTSSNELVEVHVIDNGHLKPVHALALSHDQSKLASADVRDVCVWHVSSATSCTPIIGKSRWCFHTQRITCLAWSPDDTIVASGGADDAIYLWSLAHKTKRVHYPFAHRGGVTGLEFVSGEEWILVSVGVDACVNQWDIANDVAQKFG